MRSVSPAPSRARWPVLAIGFLCLTAWRPATTRAETPPEDLLPVLKHLAERGNAEAQYHVGMMYNNGYGVTQDLAQAHAWFQRAAASGDPLAEYKLGCYFSGQAPGVVAADGDQALAHKLVAARAGYALAQHDVAGLYYQQGKTEEAARWWKMAADQGFPMALFNLGTTYKAGEKTANPVLAYAYFKLAKLGSEGEINPRAQATLVKLAEGMSADDVAAAERFVVNWKPQPTPLTTKALSGFRAARELLASSK